MNDKFQDYEPVVPIVNLYCYKTYNQLIMTRNKIHCYDNSAFIGYMNQPSKLYNCIEHYKTECQLQHRIGCDIFWKHFIILKHFKSPHRVHIEMDAHW